MAHDPENPRIILIEDDPAISEVIRDILAFEGYAVQSYATTTEALPYLKSADVIVADGVGDDYSSLSDATRARIREVASYAPTILHSARTWAMQTPPEELGVHAIVPKPSDMGDLLDAVAGALRG